MNVDDAFGQIIIIIILTAVNAFFAAAEMAIVSINKNTLQNLVDEGNEKAVRLQKILKEPTSFLSTIQVGITLGGFFMSSSTATNVSLGIGEWLIGMGVPFGRTIEIFLITLVLTFLSIVFGEMVPKRIALQNAEKVALFSVNGISRIQKVFKPFVKLISISTTTVLKVTGFHQDSIEERVSEEEIKSMIKVGQEQGLFNIEGEDMLISIFDFDDKSAYEIMTPRTEVYDIDYDEFDRTDIQEILKTGYSRIPVYKDSNDNIIGTLYIKDIFVNYSKYDFEKIVIDEIIKEPYFIPESKKIDMLLTELQTSKNHIAIVIDEYGGFSGIVTIEDIIEEIVGDIDDEYDYTLIPIKKIGHNHYIVDGSLDLDEINDTLDIKLESENYETISGLFIELLGFIPDEDEKEIYETRQGNVLMKSIDIGDKRIQRLEIILKETDYDDKNKKETENKKDED